MPNDNSKIGEQRSTQVMRVASSVTGMVPFAGPVIQSLITEFIPNTRMDRLEKFVLELRDRVDDEQLKVSTSTA